MIASSTIILLITLHFPVSQLTIFFYLLAYLIIGFPVIRQSIKNIAVGDLFDENFLMTIATVGALALGDYAEAIAVMLFYQIGDLFEDIAVNQSKQSITALLKVKATTATVKTPTGPKAMKPEQVQPGQIMLIKPGERVALDGQLVAGQSSLDTSALTGESLPRDVKTGDTVLSGTINLTGALEVQVTKPYQESTIAHILDLVQNAGQKKTTTEKFIKRFARIYTPVVVGLALLLAIVPPLTGLGTWATWINRALVFLVISCPCALVISVPLSFFGGIGAASRHGVLIKGSNFLEVLNHVDTIAFDKTGTLTQGKFTVSKIAPVAPMTAHELLGLAAAVEQHSNHPIAQSVVAAYPDNLVDYDVQDITETAGHGISATVNGQGVIIGNAQALAAHQIKLTDIELTGTCVNVALDGQYVGQITVADQPKPDAESAITALKQHDIQTVLLTGDNRHIADRIGKQLGISHVKSDLLPAQKVTAIETLTQAAHAKNHRVAFVGDGINDTPVLARADVGIAMGGLGADAAIEAADIVIMDDQPTKINVAMKIAKRTKTIVWENITFALLVKIVFLALGAVGIVGMWEAVFADVGVTLIAIVNALRLQRL
ncbi:heavy metal translocating P-type ATPase [Secundilactobacillus odoratitofui DSM 19909 = JCM 15043]|uniref:Cd(2+)-exporting ATPase n=2 Tax=Secundilactobacillus odoratitofui TaxID=480930 RepID=A0A0R1LYP0_9LACO|nr:heavy metal translocating P-type ATPase [Secundilactobacillus odoratitofui]KRK97578.1 heavy metal translocating P-type ATPase [Secundilactobacillus odoratitofui DSM 19909 = JCM 15043]